MAFTSKAVVLPHLLAAAAIIGCGENQPPIIEESEHLILRGPSDVAVCGGTFPHMESEVILIRLLFGGSSGPVDYAWMPESHFGADEFPCSSSGYACSFDRNVYARTLVSTHELVHASRHSIPSVLEEALAEFLDAPMSADADILAPREELWEAFERGWLNVAFTYGLYQRAAHFISFLVDSEGFDEFVEFEARLQSLDGAKDASFERWKSVFEDVYGESFGETWAAYENYPDCSPAQFHRPLSACAALGERVPEATLTPAFATAPDPGSIFERELDCGQDSIYGPIVDGVPPSRASLHVVEINNPLATSVWVSLTGEINDGGFAILTNCGSCWEGAGVLVSHDAPKVLVNLESGTYALVLGQALKSSGEVGIAFSY